MDREEQSHLEPSEILHLLRKEGTKAAINRMLSHRLSKADCRAAVKE